MIIIMKKFQLFLDITVAKRFLSRPATLPYAARIVHICPTNLGPVLLGSRILEVLDEN
ncbi:hypothetical protein CY34DRAFT_508418 [Suillus luteus UH-Slu-Lm8-n1]|uniref:Uncharacterized protein n=1 Tax=Suillus luteus UH-Slu-Lm8-n1 TaxID=930992 RepID=A0A0D0A684_9AGAM|nr:hypothetical protein CY34DRAFT_508418 [Suillus luteus UH-Slu-Lm8-n1]